jgi:SAM-dependent methyltransferase
VSRLRTLAKRSRTLIVAVTLVRSAWLGIVLRIRPRRPVRFGARHRGFSLEQSVDYVNWVVREYELHQGLGPDRVREARILELGPGDNLGVALCLLGEGAARVVCLDRFVTWRDPEQTRRIYSELRKRMSPEDQARLEGVLTPEGDLAPDQDRLALIEGVAVEDAEEVLDASSFDAVISRAVLAHVSDLDRTYAVMDRLLAPGGLMAHKIDLSDTGVFSDSGHHPLTFLTISDPLWSLMRRNPGLPNRKLVDYHGRKIAELGYDAGLLVSKLVGGVSGLEPPIPLESVSDAARAAQPLVEEIRPKLLERYRRLPLDDLAVAGLFMQARKPPA